MNQHPLRIGLIGLGKAGLRHAAAIRTCGDAEIVAAADPSPAAASAAATLGVRCLPSYAAMFEGIAMNAVVVSLPHRLLPAAALAAAEHGIHVLLEKPMGVTIAEAQTVVEACRAAGVRLMVNFVHRFRAEYGQARAALQSGAIGRPVLIIDVMASGRSDLPAWVWDRAAAGGGMMLYNGIHSIDRLAWLAGAPIARVTAAMGTFCYPTDLEDNLVGTVAFRDGGLGAVVQHKSDAAATLDGWQTMIYGTRGAIKIETGNGWELVSDTERITRQTGDDDRFRGAIQEFITAIREERDPAPGGEDGIHALATTLAMYEAARHDGTVVDAEEGYDGDAARRRWLAAPTGPS